MPTLGMLSQSSPQHLDLLYALAYPNKIVGAEKEMPKIMEVAATVPPPLVPSEMGGHGSSRRTECNNDFNELDEEEEEDAVEDSARLNGDVIQEQEDVQDKRESFHNLGNEDIGGVFHSESFHNLGNEDIG